MFTGTLRRTESPNRLLRMPDTCAESGHARSTIYRLITEGLWPEPVKLGPRSVAWPAGEVDAINAARIAGKSDDDVRALVKQLTEARKALATAPIPALIPADQVSSVGPRKDADHASDAASMVRTESCRGR